MPTLRDMALTPEALHGGNTAEDALRIFDNAPALPLLAVVDGEGKPIGVIERDALLSRLAGPYGHAVFVGRPVERIMARDLLTIEAGASVSEIAAMAQELVDAGGLGGGVL